ncbi:MAG TPA: glycosyltransferase [Bacteroidales bacterium]|nr:glycosyltransferase [Bacteroidales bacterium]HPT20321.1 glycosyltransferase [Bacteroidales bacterium]
MSNLFLNWPKDRIALASFANILAEADTKICENYYQLGYNGKLHPFPLNIVLPKINCGPVVFQKSNGQGSQSEAVPGRFKKTYNIVQSILHFLGILIPLYKAKVDRDFLNWISEFNPDIIYFQPASLNSIQMVSEIAETLKTPVALHFMDDWIKISGKFGLLDFYWRRKTETELEKLIGRSTLLMSIGEAMSQEYRRRYKRDFTPFHNPIDVERWLPYSKNDWSCDGKFKVLYAGRIGLGMKDSVVDVARVVNSMSSKYPDINFEILSPDGADLNGKVPFNNNIIWTKPLPYSELPKKFASADLLVLPIDFDKKSIRFLKYSFQTKISEYMISGTPVLVYAPNDTSTSKYAEKDKWAYLLNERNDQLLENAILKLYLKPELRKELGERAKSLALSREDANIVREEFRQCIVNSLKIDKDA